MSRHSEIIVVTEFFNLLWTRSVNCRDIARNVATLFMMLISIYVATENVLYNLSPKSIMLQHREIMSQH